MKSAKAFRQLIEEASYKGKQPNRLVPLTNITFFLGAGFSKSWNTRLPTGNELFGFDLKNYSETLSEYLDNLGYRFGHVYDYNTFRDIAYQIGMQRKYPSMRSRYIDRYNLDEVENALHAAVTKRFSEIATLNYTKTKNEKLQLPENPSKEQLDIVQFFRWVNDQATGDTEIPEGIRTHFITTNYDFLIESISDGILSDDDSHFLYTYRGFTPSSINTLKNPRKVFNHWLVSTLIKINGGFEIFDDGHGGFCLDYTVKSEEELDSKAPVLIVPNREQDYTGNYFQTIFPKAIRLLQETNILVVVGYSLPEEDALLKILLRQFAEENVDGSVKAIFFVNPMPEKDQLAKLEVIFPYHARERKRYNIFPYSGFFTNWIKFVMKGL